MFVALCSIDLLIPASRSLKAKRSVLQRIKGRLIQRFQVSVAEVGFQDRRQRGLLGAAIVGERPGYLRDRLQALRNAVEQEHECQILSWIEEVQRFDPDGFGLVSGVADEDDIANDFEVDMPEEDEFE
ncbi:MAG: DUF503 domain-containing protein [Candidatus Eisenbacteria bacterium]|uniref:DUF503 domain-containing protein n=1 Tax=Eiseniibacteriota bacterium TaxID=2212470 RepID=A0A948RW60_UNCEI|nr:DUF503 domain-containing protein [Candidatus Eisenbacteria bacterium]MBU1951196.1 DUF503 domain-containing protein [Candidatus Eisenbacteria bacterium]MBU2690617.1 DUF503 domain-containing protein [Candidatus Eisenbacteria bacterium]